MTMITCPRPAVSAFDKIGSTELSLESTLQELPLYEFEIESKCLVKELANSFEDNLLLPGATIIQNGEFLGIISRRRFLEFMSRPYGLEIFLKRPINVLHSFAYNEPLIFPSNTLIVTAAQRSLARNPELLYEPIGVQCESQVYKLLDVHHLLIAQSRIHQLTTQLLEQQTKSKMMQTEKLASLGQMVAGLAHEFLNPVNFISGNLKHLLGYSQDILELLAAYDEEFPETSDKITQLREDIDVDFIQKDLPQIVDSMNLGVERLVKIISSLKNFSHMDNTKKRETNIHECIDSTLLILGNRLKTGIEVVKNYGALPPVNCFSGQISQVFMNVLSNAIDALLDKFAEQPKTDTRVTPGWLPQITITTEVRSLSTESENSDNSRWVAIRIADNGPGIPQEIQQHIFENFFTTKPMGKGTGLGLAISYQIVTENHQGKLNMSSEPGVGTEFEVLLPLI